MKLNGIVLSTFSLIVNLYAVEIPKKKNGQFKMVRVFFIY